MNACVTNGLRSRACPHAKMVGFALNFVKQIDQTPDATPTAVFVETFQSQLSALGPGGNAISVNSSIWRSPSRALRSAPSS